MHVRAQTGGKKSAVRDATSVLSTLGQAQAEMKETAPPIPEPRGPKWGARGPNRYPGRRPEEGSGQWRPRGVPGSAHLATALCAPGRARFPPARSRTGSPLLGETRPPETAGGGPELTCSRNRAATAACQSSAPSEPRAQGLEARPAAPRLLPPGLPNRERPTPRTGAWSDGRVDWGRGRSWGRGRAGPAL